jgi:hypothetical protein
MAKGHVFTTTETILEAPPFLGRGGSIKNLPLKWFLRASTPHLEIDF